MSTASGTAAAKKAAARARRNEATDEPRPMSFKYDGFTYVISPEAASDVELLEHLEDEKYILGLRGILGKEQWNRYKDSIRTPDGRVPLDLLEPFLDKVLAAIGQGNSSASPIS